MSAAVAAALCTEPVAVENAECTEKSFPGFWEILEGMGK
jgi:5-enolpyruvylshikimate-3-phosphate synthase